MARDGSQLLAGAESARQRLRDALAIERGSYPFARDYGSTLGDLVDRNVDTAYEARVYAGVADAINHPPNGLDDIALQEIRVRQALGLVEVEVFAEWIGEDGERTPIGVRQSLVNQNIAPTARAGADQAGIAAGAEVTLDGSASSDPDGSIASYLWEQTAGSTVALSDDTAAMPTFTAPSMAMAQTLAFRLTVTDDRGGSATDTVDVGVAASANQPPTARAGADQAGIAAGAEVTLDGSASSDPDGSIASYLWEQTAGSTVALSDDTAAMPTFTAPSMAMAQTLAFRLTVTDDRGATAADTINIAVAALVNQPPTARAGADQNVAAGANVQLDGSASSDPDGSVVSYLWEQTAGDDVALSDDTAAMPTFTAPSMAVGQTLTLRLTVTDDRGATAADTIDIAVAASAAPPPPSSYRFDTIETLRSFATFAEGSEDGRWEIIASASTSSSATGPGRNSAGPYAATDASGGTYQVIQDNSVFDLDVEANWPIGTGRVLRLRCCIQGQFDESGEGLTVQGMAGGGAWEDIELIRGWAYSDRDVGDVFDDYGGTERACVLAGGWVDVDVAIPDQYEQVRLRLVASGGPEFNHDIALWSAELGNS